MWPSQQPVLRKTHTWSGGTTMSYALLCPVPSVAVTTHLVQWELGGTPCPGFTHPSPSNICFLSSPSTHYLPAYHRTPQVASRGSCVCNVYCTNVLGRVLNE